MTTVAACRTCGTERLADARFCHGCGAPVQDGASRAEYKQVTVLFADLVHSMDIASAVGAERLREIIAESTTGWCCASSGCCGYARCWLPPAATSPPTAIFSSDTARRPHRVAGWDIWRWSIPGSSALRRSARAECCLLRRK